jgi:hypothetical protein
MTLVSSGQISIDDIRNEIGTSDGSLRALSSLAGKSTPDSLSEFYSYNAYTYIGTYGAYGPCSYDYWDIYQRANGVYYRWTGVSYYPMYDYADLWYEYLYYDFFFDGNVYAEYEINSTSTVLTYNGDTFSPC